MNMLDKDLRYNKDGFFNLRGWLKKIGVNYLKEWHTVIFTAVRNMGKSVGSWDFILKDYWENTNWEWKVAICRTNDLRMQEAMKSFKAVFKKDYEVIGGYIFHVERDKDNKVIETSRKMCGRFVNVENEHNYRSAADGGFKDFHLVFWDEFNETKQVGVDLYKKFINLLSTIKRFNNPFLFLIIGNKINANNDIFIKLNLMTRRKNYDEDFIQKVTDHVTYIDIGYNTYRHLTLNSDNMVEELASFDEQTSRFFSGGFLEGVRYNVLNYQNFTNGEPKYYFTLGQNIMEFGSFFNKDISESENYYIKEVLSPLYDINIVALDVAGYANQGMRVDEKDLIQVADMLYEKIQNKTLYYGSFFIMDLLEKWIFKTTSLFKD